MTHAEALALARKKKRAAEAKGRRLQYLARDYFVSLGARVCIAWKLTHWFPKPGGGGMFAIQVRHDFYGLWDLIVCWPDGRRGFVQVTTLNNVAAKRTAILLERFPATAQDMIVGHEYGRTFRLLRGPAFVTGKEQVEAPKRPKGGKRGRPSTKKVMVTA